MAQRYWFKAHKHGYGWHPHTWEAWVIFFLYIGALVYSFLEIDKISHSVTDTLFGLLPRFFIFSALLLSIAYLKGEPTTWRWGEKNK
jgi:hypothetical protein